LLFPVVEGGMDSPGSLDFFFLGKLFASLSGPATGDYRDGRRVVHGA
jgi:hypothetical protein